MMPLKMNDEIASIISAELEREREKERCRVCGCVGFHTMAACPPSISPPRVFSCESCGSTDPTQLERVVEKGSTRHFCVLCKVTRSAAQKQAQHEAFASGTILNAPIPHVPIDLKALSEIANSMRAHRASRPFDGKTDLAVSGVATSETRAVVSFFGGPSVPMSILEDAVHKRAFTLYMAAYNAGAPEAVLRAAAAKLYESLGMIEAMESELEQALREL
jgi:hypothetical protein